MEAESAPYMRLEKGLENVAPFKNEQYRVAAFKKWEMSHSLGNRASSSGIFLINQTFMAGTLKNTT